MQRQPPKNRFLKLLRRTGASTSRSARSPSEEAELWAAHERTAASVRVAAEAAARAATASAKQRTALDALSDQGRALPARLVEMDRTLTRAGEALERLSLTALNAGLEASRLGEGGRALSLVADDVRTQTSRAQDSARGLQTAHRELAVELQSVGQRIDEARTSSAEIAADVGRAREASADADRSLTETVAKLKRATGTDPDTVRAVAEVSEHARALVAALGTLSGKVPQGLLAAALRPVVDPLLRVLEEGEGGTEDER
jgi:methyl-accepting chemotaxis protein